MTPSARTDLVVQVAIQLICCVAAKVLPGGTFTPQHSDGGAHGPDLVVWVGGVSLEFKLLEGGKGCEHR